MAPRLFDDESYAAGRVRDTVPVSPQESGRLSDKWPCSSQVSRIARLRALVSMAWATFRLYGFRSDPRRTRSPERVRPLHARGIDNSTASHPDHDDSRESTASARQACVHSCGDCRRGRSARRAAAVGSSGSGWRRSFPCRRLTRIHRHRASGFASRLPGGNRSIRAPSEGRSSPPSWSHS